MDDTLHHPTIPGVVSGSLRKRITRPFRRFFLIHLRGGLTPAFRARIHLVVAEANGCRYCNYLRTLDAIKAGVSRSELKKVLKGNYAPVPDAEQVALLFARHYVETKGKPDPMTLHRLRITYGGRLGDEILKLIDREQSSYENSGSFRRVYNRFRDLRARDLVDGKKRQGILLGLLLLPLLLIALIWKRRHPSSDL